MRCPSVSRLTAAFPHTLAKGIRHLCQLADKPEELRDLIETIHLVTAAYMQKCHSDPMRSRMWRRMMILHAIDVLMDGNGVEALGPNVGGPNPPPFEYINMGDPYVATLIYTRETDTLRIGCWGDIVERHERRNWS